MKYENIVLSERSLEQNHMLWFHVYKTWRLDKFIEVGSRLMVARVSEVCKSSRQEWKLIMDFSWEWRKCSKLDSEACITMNKLKSIELYTLSGCIVRLVIYIPTIFLKKKDTIWAGAGKFLITGQLWSLACFCIGCELRMFSHFLMVEKLRVFHDVQIIWN